MSKKLLLADDSITIQKVIGITFANEDYELTVVDNGDAALEKARILRPDLILADVFMPGKNGYELCAAIRQDPGLSHVPVLLLTGTFEPFDEGKARQAGATDWISKPFESQGLIDRVEKLLAATVAPAAAAVVSPSASVPPAAPAAEVEEEVWDDFAEPEEFSFEEVAAAPAEDLETDVEWATGFEPAADAAAAAEEDPWGSVSFGEEDLPSQEGSVPPSASEDLWAAPSEPVAGKDAVEEEESFVFEEEEETFSFADVAPSAPAPAAEWDEEDEVLALGDNDILEVEDLETTDTDFIFDEEEELLGTPAALGGAPVSEQKVTRAAEEEFVFGDEEPEWGGAADFGAEAAPEVVTPPRPAPAPPVASVPPAASVPPEAAVERQVREMSEEELSRIIERIAGTVIKRLAESILQQVAWEVVPDLAENLIKDELRRIRSDVQG
ncbi:putative histidine kinase [Desulfuromonas soudanensis]|uniref:Putative histidine kinase n=1 Tax=Desulfuromonas soudanensis TaxID=1603606 RepID=A0A0M4D0A6_9BACT|nr:response regulator [Desulfuromonas soudanensis]ALC15908.1 putative histidine kinase [Desulfuromonas soudanensis]